MGKSFIDRIFPPSASPLLPQQEQAQPLTGRSLESPRSSPRIRMRASVPPSVSSQTDYDLPLRSASDTSTSPERERKSLQATPLSASVLHYDDPFLPIERATRALQESIQSLLDVQSRSLSGRLGGVEQDDTLSTGSLTPTQSSLAPKSPTRIGAVPIRQPLKRKVGLRGARKGLTKKMHEFAELREQELQILETQSNARTVAIQRVEELEAKRHACQSELQSIRQEDTHGTVSNLRAEAQAVKSEIEELEHKLLEMRVKQQHLLNRADQLESTLESKMSSFDGAMAMVDREVRDFLRRPIVSHALASAAGAQESGMYALKPDRRTLEMAKEQWSSEQEVLARRKVEVEDECNALFEGERVWSEAVQRIDRFEQHLRSQTAALVANSGDTAPDSMDTVLSKLDEVIQTLESDLAAAESKSWNLLICAIGAELETFHQARAMLERTQSVAGNPRSTVAETRMSTVRTNNIPSADEAVAANANVRPSSSGSDESNQSLKDTIHAFSNNIDLVDIKANNNNNNMNKGPIKYESEDDEPPADFLLSR